MDPEASPRQRARRLLCRSSCIAAPSSHPPCPSQVWAWACSVAAMKSAQTSMQEQQRPRSLVDESLTTLVAFHQSESEPPASSSRQPDDSEGRAGEGEVRDRRRARAGGSNTFVALSSHKGPLTSLTGSEGCDEIGRSSRIWESGEQQLAEEALREDPSARLLSYYLRERDLRSTRMEL